MALEGSTGPLCSEGNKLQLIILKQEFCSAFLAPDWALFQRSSISNPLHSGLPDWGGSSWAYISKQSQTVRTHCFARHYASARHYAKDISTKPLVRWCFVGGCTPPCWRTLLFFWQISSVPTPPAPPVWRSSVRFVRGEEPQVARSVATLRKLPDAFSCAHQTTCLWLPLFDMEHTWTPLGESNSYRLVKKRTINESWGWLLSLFFCPTAEKSEQMLGNFTTPVALLRC